MSNELEIFKGQDLSLRELNELDQIPHSQLLNTAFDDLNKESDQNGNTPEFDNLRIEHAAKLLDYWRTKIIVYKQAVAEGRILESQELIRGEEKLLVSQMGVYERDEEAVLYIKRQTKTEDDEVSITAIIDSGVDEFLHPPSIKSKIRLDPEEPSFDIYFEVILRSNAFKPGSPFRISRIERALVKEDPEYKRSSVKDIRILDCSSFGVEGSFE